MGWTNAHLHQFVFPGTRSFGLRQGFGGKLGNESRTTLGALLEFPGAKLLYEYDFGDCWRHELVLERVLLGDESFRQMCVAGENGLAMTLHLDLSNRTRSTENCGVGVVDSDRGLGRVAMDKARSRRAKRGSDQKDLLA
jgi:hypothetical protein